MTQSVDGLEIRTLLMSEVPLAAQVLGRGMRDNPLHVAALGRDPIAREKGFAGVFRAFLALEVAKKGRVVGAFKDRILVGVCGMMRPGSCQLAVHERVMLLPRLLRHCGLGGTGKLLSQFGNWSGHDLAEPHWHLGPVGIEPELQGKGIGSLLLSAFCRMVDDEGVASWLETDKEVNVSFYRRHGFEVVSEDTVNGVPNWFMKRRPGCRKLHNRR